MASALFLGYVAAFGLASLGCFSGLVRAREIENRDVSLGLEALLVTSGLWGAAHVGYLVSPSFKLGFYVFGLGVGFAAVGAWLYFCSAYTGRIYHRQRPYRVLALVVFLGIMVVKLTNPFHSLYYTTEFVSSPFPHLAVRHGTLHWVVMALAYGIAFIGFFMLYEKFVQINFDTKPLIVLVGVTALPALFDVLGNISPTLIDMTYEPLGVAVFAVGVTFVYFERFQAVQLAEVTDSPAVFLDSESRIIDSNAEAREMFPSLEDALGMTLEEVVPEIDAGDEDVIELDYGGETRYFRVSTTALTAGSTVIGSMVVLDDVTRTEQYRRELEEKTEKLERFSSVVSHDLRNPLNVAQGRLDIARDNPEEAEEHLSEVERALSRMESLITDILALAREGKAIEETEEVDLASVVEKSWGGVETGDAEISVEDDVVFMADPDRLQQLFENLFRNSVDHGGPDVRVEVGRLEDGIYVKDDGPGIPIEERDDVFRSGYSTDKDGTGFGLSIVKEIAEGHGWGITVEEGMEGGARFEITGIEFTG